MERLTFALALGTIASLPFAASCAGALAEKQHAHVTSVVRATVQSSRRPSYVAADGDARRLWKLTRTFYANRQFAPAWIEGSTPKSHVRDLITALWAGDHEGLDPQLYNVALIDQKAQEASRGFLTKKGFEPNEAGAFDVWLTYLYLKYASDLADGLSDLAHADPKWRIKPEKFDPRASLEDALAKNRIAESLEELSPDNPHYRNLRHALARYREQASGGGWPKVPVAKLKPGQRHASVPAIAKRLAATGDYKGSIPSNDGSIEYTGQLVEAVRQFQRRHGLTDDGVITPAVVAQMNVPVEERIRRIRLNLERWRWLPRDLGDSYILVNIPEARLELWDHGSVPLTMRTVVGKQDTPTPIFNDRMTHVVFSPYWNVPANIAEGETLPAIMKDPEFLNRQNMEILDRSGNPVDPSSVDLSDPEEYRFRQRPGAGNSLGLVKFMFPNQFDVYLHDTPANSLFARASRSFSHGCVRLEQPVALARHVLRDQPEWTQDRIDEAMHSGKEQHVKLKNPIPVYLGYWTARVSADGLMQFRKDIYGIDERQMALLNDRLTRMRRSAAAVSAASD